MADFYITAENVYDTAILLVGVDIEAIQYDHLENADLFITDLKTALDIFKHPIKDENFGEGSLRSIFEQHLKALLCATKNLYVILTDENKAFVQKYILEKCQKRKLFETLS